MAEDVDRIDSLPALQVIGDLLQTVSGAIQHDYLSAGFYFRNQLLIVLHLAIDKDDFLTLVAAGSRRRGHIVAGIGTLRLGGIGGGQGRVGNRGSHGAVEHHAWLKGRGQRGACRQ